jgi:hypothetical protein
MMKESKAGCSLSTTADSLCSIGCGIVALQTKLPVKYKHKTFWMKHAEQRTVV